MLLEFAMISAIGKESQQYEIRLDSRVEPTHVGLSLGHLLKVEPCEPIQFPICNFWPISMLLGEGDRGSIELIRTPFHVQFGPEQHTEQGLVDRAFIVQWK